MPMPAPHSEQLDMSALETWLWDAACAIRGATDAPKFKDFILPLVFYKRLSDVFDDEVAKHAETFGSTDVAGTVIEQDHADALRTGRKPIVRFFVPTAYQWDRLRNHGADGKLGEFVTTAMRETARLNPDLQGVLDVKDFNERQSGQRTLDDDRLSALIEVISRHRLGLNNTEPDVLGRAYEYLLRKFAEGQGQSAGEFYTPKEVGYLMADLLDPQPYTEIHDPTCGSGGLLLKPRLRFEQNYPEQCSQAPRLFGQELNPTTYAMAKMNMFLHDYTDSVIAIGDTFTNPRFASAGAGLRRFDCVVANPMWNQDNYAEAFYDADAWNRFTAGQPPASQVLLINASAYFVKRKPKNELTEDGIVAVTDAYRAWESREKLSRVITLAEARAADYNLSPSQFVTVADRVAHRPLDAILFDIARVRDERERADAELSRVLEQLGLAQEVASND